MTIGGLILLITTSTEAGGKEVNKEAEKRARGFLTALAKGDIKRAREFCAPKITIIAQSGFLRPEWGLNPNNKDRTKNVEVDRDKLLDAYQVLITERVGKDRWLRIWADLTSEKRAVLSVSEEKDKPFSGMRPGDVELRVIHKGPLDDPFIYVLRKDEKGQWWLVMIGQ